MKRWPREVREALTTKLDAHELVLDPVARRVTVRAPDGKSMRLRIDLIDGFTTPAIVGGIDRTRDVIAALAPILRFACALAHRYELAAFALVRHAVEREHDLDVAACDTAQAMQACGDNLRELKRWCRFHADLTDREDELRRLSEEYGEDSGS